MFFRKGQAYISGGGRAYFRQLLPARSTTSLTGGDLHIVATLPTNLNNLTPGTSTITRAETQHVADLNSTRWLSAGPSSSRTSTHHGLCRPRGATTATTSIWLGSEANCDGRPSLHLCGQYRLPIISSTTQTTGNNPAARQYFLQRTERGTAPLPLAGYRRWWRNRRWSSGLGGPIGDRQRSDHDAGPDGWSGPDGHRVALPSATDTNDYVDGSSDGSRRDKISPSHWNAPEGWPT